MFNDRGTIGWTVVNVSSKSLQLIRNDDDSNCSDDGGETYELSSSTFPRADESSLAHVGEEQLVVNLRRDVKVIHDGSIGDICDAVGGDKMVSVWLM